MLCSCRLDIPQAPLSPYSAHSPLLVHCGCCLPSQSLCLAPVRLGPRLWPTRGFPERASVLDSILCGFAFALSSSPWSRPRHALVARNGSWRDFRRSRSPEDQARFHLLRQQFHSTVRSSRTRFWNEWLGSVTSLSRRAPRRACSLIRRTFRSSGVTPDLYHMQRHGPSCSALPPDEARSLWRAQFSSPTGDSLFFRRFFPVRFSPLRVSHVLARIRQI